MVWYWVVPMEVRMEIQKGLQKVVWTIANCDVQMVDWMVVHWVDWMVV